MPKQTAGDMYLQLMNVICSIMETKRISTKGDWLDENIKIGNSISWRIKEKHKMSSWIPALLYHIKPNSATYSTILNTPSQERIGIALFEHIECTYKNICI